MTTRKNDTSDQKQRQMEQTSRDEATLTKRDLTNVDQSEAAQNDTANANQPGQTITQQIDAATGEPVPTGRMQQDRNL